MTLRVTSRIQKEEVRSISDSLSQLYYLCAIIEESRLLKTNKEDINKDLVGRSRSQMAENKYDKSK